MNEKNTPSSSDNSASSGPVTFTANDAGAIITYEFVLENNRPVKLGDGTFGCVFHVRGQNKNCALKLFYETNERFIIESQQLEMTIGKDLLSHYIDSPDIATAVENYLVVPISAIDDFSKQPAYKRLKKYFESLSFKISDKAIVMDFYPMSLKDLLERGWPTREVSPSAPAEPDSPDGYAGPLGRGAGGTFGYRSGYSILRALPQDDRERSILPIIQDVAQGLSILHGANRRHQDIKPANILVRQVGSELRAAVADLGFIDTGTWQVAGSIAQDRPIGTRHYRSPEQTDAFDVCEVDIDDREQNTYRLTTRDPKFFTTFSECGDFVVFAKLPERWQWEIVDIRFPNGKQQDAVSTDPVEIIINALDGVPLQPDKRTQIAIHKRQTARTDLFGLGAIIYDLLTCGRSPEQFYDLLRAHDRPDTSIGSGLAQRYVHFKNGGGTVPEVDAVFQSLRVDVNNDFPSQGIVNIILKCMLSRPKDSYFNAADGQSIWDTVKGDLAALSEGSVTDLRQVGRNYLTRPDSTFRQTKEPSARSPNQTLQAIQSLGYNNADEFAKRMVRGSHFFVKIATMIRAEIEGGNGDFNYLVDVSPDNLDEWRAQYVPKIAFFEREEQLNQLLLARNPRFVLQSFSSGNLLPPFMRALVRDCEVWVAEKMGKGSVELIYDPWDTDYGWSYVNAGDRVSVELSPTEMVSGIVKEEQGGRLRLSGPGDDVFRQLVPWQRYRASIVRRFTPGDYYVSMLGIYLRLVFFVDPLDRKQGIPGSVFTLQQIARQVGRSSLGRNMGRNRGTGASGGKGLLQAITKTIGGAGQAGAGSADDVFSYLAELYLRLITRQVVAEFGLRDVGQVRASGRYSYPADETGAVVADVMHEFSSTMGAMLGVDGSQLLAGSPAAEKTIAANGRTLEAFPNIEALSRNIVDGLVSGRSYGQT